MQNDQNLHKYNQRARIGQVFEFSHGNYYIVANARNLSNGYISPQFHFVFDDLFEMVIRNKDDDNVSNDICNYLFDLNKDWYVEN